MKPITEHSDRELLEKIAVNAKQANSNANFVKNYIIVLTIISIILAIASQCKGQAQPMGSDTVKYAYCELLGIEKFLSTKVTIQLDFGQEKKFWVDTRVRDEQTGKIRVFNSMIDAMNFMGDDGWEFVQAYVITIAQQNVYHWLLKKRRYSP